LAVGTKHPTTPQAGHDVLASTRVCFGGPPSTWTTAMGTTSITLPAGVGFGLGGLSGNLAFGQWNTATGGGIAGVDMTTGQLTTISTYGPGVGGLGGMAVELPWLVWEQLDSQTNTSDWSIHAWNQTSGTSEILGTSRQGDGTEIPGQQPLPVLDHGVVAWAQPVAPNLGEARAEIHVVDLFTGRVSVLDSGHVSSPVYAGPYLIWGKYIGETFSFRAVIASTGRAVDLPTHLQHPGSIGYLAGSSQYLLWSNQGSTALTSWQIGSSHYMTFHSPDDHHHFQFLQASGPFALWFGGATSSILDLRTGKAFDLQGTVTASSERIATAESAEKNPLEAAITITRVANIPMSGAPRISRCTVT